MLRDGGAKVVGLTAALAADFMIGREGPMVHLTATVAVLLMRLPAFTKLEVDPAKKRAMLQRSVEANERRLVMINSLIEQQREANERRESAASDSSWRSR